MRQLLHQVEAFEGVLRVKDARLEEALALNEGDAPAEVAVDCRAADDDGKREPARLLLRNADRHLFARRDKQRRESNRIGVHLCRLFEDRVHRHLLAEIENAVTIIRQNRVDEVLADVVHIAEDGGEHDFTFGRALLFL